MKPYCAAKIDLLLCSWNEAYFQNVIFVCSTKKIVKSLVAAMLLYIIDREHGVCKAIGINFDCLPGNLACSFCSAKTLGDASFTWSGSPSFISLHGAVHTNFIQFRTMLIDHSTYLIVKVTDTLAWNRPHSNIRIFIWGYQMFYTSLAQLGSSPFTLAHGSWMSSTTASHRLGQVKNMPMSKHIGSIVQPPSTSDPGRPEIMK